MAEIKGFKGLRYTEKAGDIGQLCCPPYDIINASVTKSTAFISTKWTFPL